MDEDFMVALQLQEQPMSIVDESWEILDPSPDVRAMFLEFNAMFFEGKLSGVEVKWSPRMTLCAGVCSYEGRGGLCSIRLSEPLLKLRPRRDLVQTLLHEMIHALLFVTQNNRDRDGHGPEFCKHMERINTATGTKITVYHSFTDEVDLYRQHWWKCDGPCQHRKPYFGFVKRAMNRAPSANDPWWGDHQRTCGGTYNKVKEPEGYGKKKGKAESGKAQSGKDKMAEGKKDMIPFSGKGVLLGGSQPSSSPKSPEPVWKRPFPSPVSSPKRPPFSPPPRNKLGSPTDAFLDSLGKNSSGTLPLNKPPTKRSVGNTKYFVSINGSPVRVPKPNRGNVGPGSAKQHTPGGHILNAKQKSVKELFDSFSITESTKPLTDSNGKTPSSTRQQVNPPSTLSKYPSGAPTMSKPSPTKPSQSNCSSSVPLPLMVSCPVCQVKVQESKINEHLDSCLC
uniref:DNA-dependent metalloprotease SPRTN n=1 Tax=Gadus morhua TaxID=8049 RepID=A0A8C5CZD6_GADMO